MGIFYNASKKELLEIRNKIFVENAIPNFLKNGFVIAPFLHSSNGKHPDIGYCYEYCRLKNTNELEYIKTYISRGDKWIKININIFELESPVLNIEDLRTLDSITLSTPPNSIKEMRLHVDCIGTPFFNYNFMFSTHKLGFFFFKSGLKRSAKKLGLKIGKDLSNIEKFISIWRKNFKIFKITNTGKISNLQSMTVNERLHYCGLTKQFERSIVEDKIRAKHILGWIEVDENSIKEIIGETKKK